MISAEELDGLRETVAILSDPELVRSMQVAAEEARSGQGEPLSYDQAKALIQSDVSD